MDRKQVERALRNKMLNNTHKRRRVFPTANGRRRTRYHLAEFCGEMAFKRGAEVGVRLGRFSRHLCDKNPHLETLYCVDPWHGYNARYRDKKQERIYQDFLKRTEGYDKIEVVRKTSMDALSLFEDGSLDFVFIDGNHTFDFAMMDIICWPKKIKSGGLVMVHDFYPFDNCGVWNAVQSYSHSHNLHCYTTKEHEPTAYWVNP